MNHNNLLALAKFLDELTPKAQFNMAIFRTDEDCPSEVQATGQHTCGTVACAIGWAPSILASLPNESTWDAYSKRVFGIAIDDEEWDFLFSAGWRSFDNTPKGAAARIRYLVNNGYPHPRFRDMMAGEYPLEY